MAYQAFKFTRLPKRVTLTISGVAVELEKTYLMADQHLILPDYYLGYPAEPLDDFGYKIQPFKRAEWSDEIQFEFNVVPKLERPSCVSGSVPVLSKSLTDITALFPFAENSDRIRIDAIDGINNNLMIQGEPVRYGTAYMIYDFVQVEWQSIGPSQVGSLNNYSTISYTMGKKGEWGDSCTVQVDLLILAAISSENSLIVQESPSFERIFNIENGIPGTYTLVNIVSSGAYDAFAATMSDFEGNQSETLLALSGDVLLSIPIANNGKARVSLKGTPTLLVPTDPYLHVIDVEILSSDGYETLIDPLNYITTMFVTNDLTLVDQFGAIGSVVMSNAEIGSVSDDYTQETEAPSDVDIVAEINMRTNVGLPPFTYDVTQESGDPVTIVQQGTTAKFDITGMVGAIDPGSKHVFEASVVDSNNITSRHTFSFTVLDVVLAAVPVITAPTYKIVDAAQFFSTNIVASNGPILSYSALYLPAGLTLNTVTGEISGKISVGGNYAVILRATNSVGVSIDYNWNILVNAPAASIPPVITSSDFVDTDLDGGAVAYQLTYSGSDPVTVIVSGIPSRWYYNSLERVLYGTMTSRDDFQYVTFRVTNAAGVDEQEVTFYRHP